MSQPAKVSTEVTEVIPRLSNFQHLYRVLFRRGLVRFGMIIILVAVIAAIFAPSIAPYDPYEVVLGQQLQGLSKAHLLGTDSLGRDTFTRLVYGARTSLIIGVVVISLAAVVGMGLGLIAGYFGGWVYIIIMRFIDALMAFPMIVMCLVIAALLGGGLKNVIIALTIGLVPANARLMCAEVLTIKEHEFIMSEHSLGASNLRVMFYHLIPNCFPPLIVFMTMMLSVVIISEAGLSFLGIGIEPPMAAWGSMVSEGRAYILRDPILAFSPGLAIMLVTFSFNMIGDGLRDALDPRLRGIL